MDDDINNPKRENKVKLNITKYKRPKDADWKKIKKGKKYIGSRITQI